MPLVFALLQNRKGAEGRWAGPGLVGGAGPGRVSMCSARSVPVAAPSGDPATHPKGQTAGTVAERWV